MDYNENDIAIVGMAVRFPGASTLEQYWENLRSGTHSISFFEPEELADLPFIEERMNQPNVVRAGGILDDVDRFDAPFFGFSRREAEITDPQHRLLMETSWHALEHSGHDPDRFPGLVGVFVGASAGSYLFANLAAHPEIISSVGRPRVMMGNTANFLSTWLSYKLNLRGPSLTVQTACSTGLVAVHLAWQSLLNGECDMAIAGASSIAVPQKSCYVYREGGIQSPDGYCRAFDADAKGTVGGNGVGVVVLRRLVDAIEDGDRIHAVIKGSAINNDGSLKVGYTAPSVEGQASVVAEALAVADAHPESIQYIEAHGTGTPLGDPIEITALSQVFRSKTEKKGFCSIGSVKPNIGHLDTAAGIAGLIKAVLALEHGELPPTLNFQRPNPECGFEDSPFVVNDRLRPWPETDGPRRAGVSSLGIGGTNAHLVLEEAPRVLPSVGAGRPAQLLCISARTPQALADAREDLADALSGLPESALADVGYTLALGRKSFAHRVVLVCRELEEAVAQLRGEADHRQPREGHAEERTQGVVFLFPGQGTLTPGLGAELYRVEAAFREEVDRCLDAIGGEVDADLRALLFSDEPPEEAADTLTRTSVQQPALFLFEYALARLWESWGVRPSALLGHSLGEYVAACLSGVLSLEDALRLIVRRGRLMDGLPAGMMLAVSLSEEEVGEWLDGEVSLAAVNGDRRVVLSGPEAAIVDLAKRLSEAGVPSRRLETSRAFHSPLVEPALAPYREALVGVTLNEPGLPVLSNVTGTWLTAEEATDEEYWCRHMRQPVRFGEALATALAQRDQVLIEVGPGRSLSSLARHRPEVGQGATVVCSLPDGRGKESHGPLDQLLLALGEAWLAGLPVDWEAFHRGQRKRLVLPGYPFQHESYWVDHRPLPGTGDQAAPSAPAAEPKAAPSPREASPPAPPAAPDPARARTAAKVGRRARLLDALRGIVREITGADAQGIDTGTTFFELGVDSLLLIQASEQIEKTFGLAVPFRSLFEELATLDALADYLDRELPAGVLDDPEPEPEPVSSAEAAPVHPASSSVAAVPPAGAPTAAVGDGATRLMERQIETMRELFAQQLAILSGGAPRAALSAAAETPAHATERAPAAAPATKPAAPTAVGGQEEIGPYRPIDPGDQAGLEERQGEHLAELIDAYTSRTARSRDLAERYRPVFADNRSSVGFRHVWKELTYPIVAERSAGSKMWDVDGNEYVDVTMGFGVNLLGHAPPMVRRAIEEQMEKGIHLGPQSDLAGEVAERLCRMTGLERAIFTNSGTEAVMTATRIARTVTGRRKIAMFHGSYHGFYDGTLGRALDPERPENTVPVAPGITEAMVEDLLVFEYGTDRSLELLEKHAGELAAVLVEPVQSRRPSFRPVEFLRRLREITERHGTVLIFDEMVTGFRCHPGGAQALFGVPADLATYGKAVGGGLPVGVVAGRAELMDAIDGGAWHFGDGSFPSARQTFFAGTFCKHPLAMRSARAVLEHLEAEGPALQERLGERTAAMAARLNDWFDDQGHPLRIDHFASLFRFTAERPWMDAELLRFHLVLRGIYVWEGGTRYLSTVHDDEDVDRVVTAVQESVEALADGGFLPWSPGGAPEGRPRRRAVPEESATPATTGPAAASEAVEALPLTEAQRQVWVLCRMGDDVSRAYNESLTLDLEGPLDVDALRRAVQGVADRHEALRTSFDPDEPLQRIHPHLEVPVRVVDRAATAPEALDEAVAEEIGQEIRRPFDLSTGPCLRALLVRKGEDSHSLVLVSHHIVTDGQSFGSMTRDFLALYARAAGVEDAALPEVASYRSFVATFDQAPEAELNRAEEYWLRQLEGVPPFLDLPTDRPRPRVQTFDADRLRHDLPPELGEALRSVSSREGATLFMTLLAGLDVLLHHLTGETDLVVGVNATRPVGRDQAALVGFRLNPIALRTRLDADASFRELLKQVKGVVLEGYEHQRYPFHRLIEELGIRRDPGRYPLGAVVFNVDRAAPVEHLGELEIRVDTGVSGSKVDVYLGVTEHPDRLELVCDYNPHLFDRERVAGWMETLEAVYRAVAEDPGVAVRSAVAAEAEAAAGTGEGAPGYVSLFEPTRYQQMILAGQRLQPDAAIYLSGTKVHIPAAVDAARLGTAVEVLVEASEAMRTVAVERDGAAYLAVRESVPPRYGLVDLSGLPGPEAEARRLVDREVRRPFDLEERLFHTFLIRVAPDDHYWYINQHHLMADALTAATTWTYVTEIYGRLGRGESPEALAAGLDVPSFDRYARAEKEYLASTAAAESEVFWHERLAGEVERLAPFGHSPEGRGTRSERETFDLAEEVTRGLRTLAERPELFVKTASVSLYNVVAGLLAMVLWRISGADVISLGVPFKNRPDETAMRALGMFMHILPVRVRMRPHESFVELVRRVSSEMRGAARHQRHPVANTLTEPLYEVELNFVNFRFPDLDGVRVENEHLHTGHSNEAMVFEIQDFAGDGELTFFIDFNRDLFSADDRRRVLDLLVDTARRVIADPESSLAEVALATVAGGAERAGGAGPEEELPVDRPFFDLFLETVALAGDKVAVRDGEGALSYRELALRARAVASALAEAGVAPGEVVGVFLPRSRHLLTSFLGLLAADAVYLPLDPAHPAQRTASILASSGARLVLAGRQELDRLTEIRAEVESEAGEDALAVALLEDCLAHGPGRLLPKPSGDQLAYVLFTSGSTGRPKGAMVEQAGMINHLYAKVRDLDLGRWDALLQSAPQTFDISIWQLLAPLLTGGEVVVAPEDALHDPEVLTSVVESRRCSVVEVVPSLLRALLDHYGSRAGGPPELFPLRHMIATGEALEVDLCRRWTELYGGRPLWNAYGPTECSDDVTHHRIDAAPPAGAVRVPIGAPVLNTRLEIMGSGAVPALRGVPGELWVGGVAVGRGYLGDPRRTAEVFVPDPAAAAPGARCYRTGDLVRCLDDGAFEFLGRIDHQVKIRGHRIEPGEIEAALLAHEGVERALVVPWSPPGRPVSLVGYTVAAEGHDLTDDGLRSHLRRRVPESMVPAHWVYLDSIPLTPNGKVDRAALPEPELESAERADGYAAPRDEVERILAEVWSEVLRLDRVGVHDDFFGLGGDSILAIQIVSRATRKGLRFAPLALFEHPTVAELATVVDAEQITQAEQGPVAGKVPLTPIQHWFFSFALEDPHHWNNALLLASDERLDETMLEAAVGHLVAHHDTLRLRFRPTPRGWQQVNAAGERNRVFSVFDFSHLERPDWRSSLVASCTDLQKSLDLTRGPLLRVALFRGPEEAGDRLFVVVHHLAVDGISWRTLMEDLVAAYRQIESGQEVELPPKTVSFKEWATFLEEAASSGALAGELEHWRRVAGVTTAPIPRDRTDGENLQRHADTVTLSLSEEGTSALLRLRPAGGGIDALLLASAAAGLARETRGGQQLLVDLETHGRTGLGDLDLSRTVGWFTAVYPVAVPLVRSGGPDGAFDLPATVEAMAENLGAVPSGGLGYGVLRHLSDDPAVREVMAAIPAPEVRFNYLGQIDQALDSSSPFRSATEPIGASTGRGGARSHLLDIIAVVSEGRLQVSWVFSRDVHDPETVRRWLRRQIDALRELVGERPEDERDPLAAVASDFGWGDETLGRIAEALETE